MRPNMGIDALPDICHVVVPGRPPGRNIALSKRGRLGVEVTALNFGETDAARRVVRALNHLQGVAPEVEHAMLAGAMFGWDCDRANPAFLRQFDERFRLAPRLGIAGPQRVH